MILLLHINLYTKLSLLGDNDNGDARGTTTIIDNDISNNCTSAKSKLIMGGGGRKEKKRLLSIRQQISIRWLRKIAELNPYFKFITFTDTDCNGVYNNSCQD